MQQPPYPPYYPPPRPSRAPWILLGIGIGIFLCIASVVIVPALLISRQTGYTSTYDDSTNTSSSQSVSFVTPTPKDDVPANPWGYNYEPEAGHYIYDAPVNFCRYFKCLQPFGSSNDGFVVECNDGSYSHSGGNPDACHYDKGVYRALFWH